MKNFISSTILVLLALNSVQPGICQSNPLDTAPLLRQQIEPVNLKSEDESSDRGARSDLKKETSPDKRRSETEVDGEGTLESGSGSGSGSGSAPIPKEKGDVSIALRVVSFTTGFVVGTPIACAKCAYRQTKSGARDLIGDSKNPLVVVPATLFSIPFAVFGGPIEGIGCAALNSWQASGSEPFGQESFSLGSFGDQ